MVIFPKMFMLLLSYYINQTNQNQPKPNQPKPAQTKPTKPNPTKKITTNYIGYPTSLAVRPFFNSFLKRMLILGYAEWCGHCKTFKPTWNEFKRTYDKVIDIREVEADKDPAIMKELGINGFPTIIMLVNGKKIEYTEKGREFIDLENFVKKNLNPHLKSKLANYRSTDQKDE